jgi:hypothetical protein
MIHRAKRLARSPRAPAAAANRSRGNTWPYLERVAAKKKSSRHPGELQPKNFGAISSSTRLDAFMSPAIRSARTPDALQDNGSSPSPSADRTRVAAALILCSTRGNSSGAPSVERGTASPYSVKQILRIDGLPNRIYAATAFKSLNMSACATMTGPSIATRGSSPKSFSSNLYRC